MKGNAMRWFVAWLLCCAVSEAQTAADIRAIERARQQQAEINSKTVNAGPIVAAAPLELLNDNAAFIETVRKSTAGAVRHLPEKIAEENAKLAKIKRAAVNKSVLRDRLPKGVIVYASKAEKDAAIKQQQAEVDKQKNRVADYKSGKRVYVGYTFYQNNEPMKVGLIGDFAMPFPVKQVLSDREALCAYTDDWFLLRGVSTENLFDDAWIDTAEYIFAVTGTAGYPTQTGRRTVMVVEPIGTREEVETRAAAILKKK